MKMDSNLTKYNHEPGQDKTLKQRRINADATSWRRINVDTTSWRRINVDTTSFWNHVPDGTCLWSRRPGKGFIFLLYYRD